MLSHIVPAAPHQVPPTKSQVIVIAIDDQERELEPEAPEPGAAPADDVGLAQLGALDAEEAGPRDQAAEDEIGEAAEDDHDRERGEERDPPAPAVLLREPDEERRGRHHGDDGCDPGQAAPGARQLLPRPPRSGASSSGTVVVIVKVYADARGIGCSTAVKRIRSC